MHILQEKLLALLQENNISDMTLREIGEKIGEKYPQKIKHHLDQLEKKGFIKRNPRKKEISRLEHFKKSTSGSLLSIPIVGTANCGPATIFANENIEGFLKISSNILNKCKNVFAIRAHGLSMNKAMVDGKSIEEGDYLIIDSEYKSPKSGDIILSIIDDMANIKKYVWDEINNQVVLVSESTKSIPPIYIHEDDSFMINGKVIQVIKRPKLA